MTDPPQQIDAPYVARLLQGTLSGHEQRLLVARLLRRDAAWRQAFAAWLEPFEMFDADLAAQYERALAEEADPEPRRRELLARAFERSRDPEAALRAFTWDDVLSLGGTTRRIFSWTMAEYLLERSRRDDFSVYHARTSLYLALTVIDAVEILGASGHSPEFPGVVRDVRRRIFQAPVFH